MQNQTDISSLKRVTEYLACNRTYEPPCTTQLILNLVSPIYVEIFSRLECLSFSHGSGGEFVIKIIRNLQLSLRITKTQTTVYHLERKGTSRMLKERRSGNTYIYR